MLHKPGDDGHCWHGNVRIGRGCPGRIEVFPHHGFAVTSPCLVCTVPSSQETTRPASMEAREGKSEFVPLAFCLRPADIQKPPQPLVLARRGFLADARMPRPALSSEGGLPSS